jgi:hypothetical protein
MKRARIIEAVLCVVAAVAMIAFGLWTLRPQPVGSFTGEGGFSASTMNSSHAACGSLCWILIAWLIEHGGQYVGSVAQNNSCNPCGGGGGGGFECAPDDRSCNTMNTN